MPRKILIIDDNAINRQMLKRTLSHDYDVLEAENGEDALLIIERQSEILSAVLMDIMMPGIDGYEVLRRVRANDAMTQLPIIMVTGSEDEKSRVKALSLGANDFILKPFNPEIVLHCVKNNIALRETASTLNAIQRDKITGLYNREAFFEKVTSAIREHEPGYYVLSCFDVDNFKLINDQYGAIEGDRILKEIGRVVNEDMEEVDGIAGRISGDNFSVLLPYERRDFSINRVIQQNRLAFSDKLAIVFSIGRYVINDITLPARAIFDRAYIAKQSVKGRYDKHIAYFDDTMLDKLINDLQIVTDMDVAITERQFEVWFQPQRNHSSGALIGAEALVRWQHPERGLIPPGEFIPVFEENGFIYELDKYVWGETCRLLRKWIDEGRNPLPVSVNISRYDVFRVDFIDTLTSLLQQYEIPVELLRLEITESAFAKSTKTIVEIIKKLIAQGFTIEIDDFGSGYSSLNTLKSVPAQILKLDMRFLEDDDDSGRGGNILESIVRMARWLGMSVIAEGVETKAQADYLASVGCSYIQGYYYARPMPASDYEFYCRNEVKEECLLVMDSIVNLKNNSFWDPASMDTLIFNSYVGAACVFEYYNGNVEMLRINPKYISLFGDDKLTTEDILKLDFLKHMTPESIRLMQETLSLSKESGEDYTHDYVFLNLIQGQPRTVLRSSMRVIATSEERLLVYCISENITIQVEALQVQKRLELLANNIPGGLAIYEGKPGELDKIKLVYYTEGFSRLFGYTHEEYEALSAVNPLALVAASDVSHMRESIHAMVYDNVPLDIIYSAKIKGGGTKWINVKVLLGEPNGENITAKAVFVDATEQKNTSYAKEMAFQKWRMSIRTRDSASYSLYHCNVSQDLNLGLPEGTLILDRIRFDTQCMSERVSEYLDNCVYLEDRKRFMAVVNRDVQLLRYNQGRRSDSIEYREISVDGQLRWLRLSIDMSENQTTNEIEAYFLFENIDEVKKAELEMLARAESDPLTGLLNRKTFIERFRMLTLNSKTGTLSALFIIDMDGFKLVNDYFGHAVGDETIIEMGQKILSAFREEDLVCRLGGDEFMIYMNGVTHLDSITEKASLICSLLHKSFSLDIQLSASIGVSIFPDNGKDFETLYRKADAALYYVKKTGKDNYAVYQDNMGEKPDLPEIHHEKVSVPASESHGEPKRRMLIVEDNEVNRDYLANLFVDDFIIETAAEGTAALIKLRRYGSGISVVLLDLRMPGLDGFVVLKKMRENLATQTIPVIVVSGMDERETSLLAIREGASDFITKPVDPDILKVRVASALSKAENDQLRAQNRYLALQNDEAKRLTDARKHSEELSAALQAAERADLAKSQFLSRMSHEIRTPLNAIIGYNTIARDEIAQARTDEERRQISMSVMDYLTKSDVASRHLLTIINDVLDISAIESGKMKVEYTPFDFKSLISSLTVMFFSQARAKGVDFEVLFEKPAEEWFVGDQLRINQVLTNLLSNAVKFTPTGGHVALKIEEHIINDQTTVCRFIVSDSGIGMTAEYLEHIWSPFEQAEASISRRFGGTGLGLSITKNLVSLMNGTISVESQPDVGSIFTVDLTLGRTEQPKRSVSYDFSNVNALIVDDDPNICEYIRLLFIRCGVRCSSFTSGEEAIRAFAAARDGKNPFTLCLVDWRMPMMDGLMTISEIRKLAAKSLPIVVVTAYDFSEVSEYAQSLGISRFVSKPLFQSSLFDVLMAVSGKQSQIVSAKSNKYDFDGARVLLVEDNNMNMEVAKHMLISANLAVDCAWNGQEAIDIFTASKPGTYKAVLMDVHMPEVDGYAATRAIRTSEHHDAKSVPVIAMTADAFAEDINEALNAGMNDHIAKPINVESLFSVLRSYIMKEQS